MENTAKVTQFRVVASLELRQSPKHLVGKGGVDTRPLRRLANPLRERAQLLPHGVDGRGVDVRSRRELVQPSGQRLHELAQVGVRSALDL